MGRVVSPENAVRNARIIAMRRSGLWPFQIAEALGLGRNTVIGVLNRSGHCSSEPGQNGRALSEKCLPAEIRPKLAARFKSHDRKNGYSAMARELGVSPPALRRAIRRELAR